MKLHPIRTVSLAALLAVSLAPAQPPVSMYGGVFRPGQAVRVGMNAPARTELRLERVDDPLAVFTATNDPHRPVIPGSVRTTLVRTVRTVQKDYGDVNLGALPRGLYVLRAGRVGTLVLVTDLGMVVKRDRETALAYTADRGTGQTRAARVWRLGSPTTSAVANADGITRFRGGSQDQEFFLARFGSEWAVSGANWNRYALPAVKGFVYTDRPVYRPGQRVEFKGVLRDGTSLRPLANANVRVTVFSPFSEVVFQKTLRTNGYGSLAAGLDLPAGAKLGEYRFEARPPGAGGAEGESQVSGTFAVEAYQKPEYAVTVTPDKARAVQGERVRVRMSARYLFGGAPGGARVTYNVTRAPYWPPGFDTESLPVGPEGRDYGSDLVVREEARLDKDGNLDLTLPLERDENGQPVRYRVEAEVEDESRRTVSGFASVLAFPASVNVEARTDGYVYDAGKPIRVDLDTRDLAGRATAAPVTLDLVRQTYEKVGSEYRLRETRVARTTVRTDARGTARATLTATRGGGYLIRATVRDPRGRASTFENFAWVLKPGEDFGWAYRDMTLRLDRRQYAPGDTAVALIGNPKPGAPVLVTLEGDRLRRHVVLRGPGAVLTYRFPVTADMAPNMYVAAAALGDGNFFSTQARVNVPVRGTELTVKVMPGKARYRPGETGTLRVEVRDAQGRGVPAELTLGVVDGAIYLVRPDTSTPMLRVFHAERDNAVGTEASVYFYFESSELAAPRAAMSEAAFGQAKEARQDAATPPDETPREDFRDTILWVPNLVTDAQGRANVSVRFPDNLTTWVATARAQTTSPRFGQTTATTVTTKDVIARLSLPTFLVRGDRATLSGIAQSTLGQNVQGRALARLEGLKAVTPGAALLSNAGTPLNLAANGRVRQDLDVRADTVGTARVTFTTRTASGSDALRLPVPVKARGYDVTRTAVGSARSPEVTLRLPADANLTTARLRLAVTPSLLSAVAPALEYLVGFPYGCTEQTMSRFLPALLAREALGPDALPDDVRRDLPEIIETSVARLATFQHEDGGWGFWQYDDSSLEMTAYVLEGLVRARALGVKVEGAVLDRAVGWLSRNLGKQGESQGARARAYRALADAGRVNTASLEAFARRADLQPYALAQVAIALSRAGKPDLARDVLDRLKARRIEGQTGIHWEKPRAARGEWIDFWDDNTVQTTAAALEALARVEGPRSALVPGVSRWLLANRRGPRWLSTQDTTSVVIAALATRGDQPVPRDVPARVTLNGQALGQTRDGVLELDASALRALRRGDNALRVETQGAPDLTFAAELSFAREPADLRGDATRGLTLTRTYEKLEPVWNDKQKRYTYTRVPLLRGGTLQPVTVGDLVLVTVTVKPQREDARYVLVSDPIPAGTKALDERSLAIAGLQDPGDEWDSWRYWYAGRDFYDDRVDLYADYLSGWQKMTYVLRAQTPGTFTALPTHGFLMYDPDVEGYGPATTLTVRDRGQ